MVRRLAILCLILAAATLASALGTHAQMADSYRQAAQAYRNAAAQCSGPQQACYLTWAGYYDCVASTFQSGSRVTCQQPAQNCSGASGSTGSAPTGDSSASGLINQLISTATGNSGGSNTDPVLKLLSSLPAAKTSNQLMGRMGLGMGLEALSLFAKNHTPANDADGSDASVPSGPTLQQQLNDQEGQALLAMNAADQQQNAQQFQRSLQTALAPDAQAVAEDTLTANSETQAASPDPSQLLLNDTNPDAAPSVIPDVARVPAMEQSVAQQAGSDWSQALDRLQNQQQSNPASTNQLLTNSWQDLNENTSAAAAPSALSAWHNPLEDAVPEGLMLTAQKAASDLVSGVETTIGDALHNLPLQMAIAKGSDMLLDAKDAAVCDGESDAYVHANCMIDQASVEVGQGAATRIFAIHRQFYENILAPLSQTLFPQSQ